ncbi:MAG: hypothetical protein P4L84_23075 [Isosphaeraceae bacterium]|nr:hypothetical protein [Isosphaeraceae bacterium]
MEEVTLVGLGASGQIVALECGGVAPLEGNLQLFDQRVEEPAEKVSAGVMLEGRRHELNRPLIVGHTNMALARDPQHRLVIVPTHVVQEETCGV